MHYPESSAFKSYKKGFKEKLLPSEFSKEFPLVFYNDPLDQNREKIKNVTEIQVILAIFYTLKSKTSATDFENFVRNTIPTQSLSKSQFEKYLFTEENLSKSSHLAKYFSDLLSNCKSCNALDFCYNDWLCISQFFIFEIPPHVKAPEKAGAQDPADRRRKNLSQKLFYENNCGCNYIKTDRQSFFNYCDVCCDDFVNKLKEPAEVSLIDKGSSRTKLEFYSDDKLKNFALRLELVIIEE